MSRADGARARRGFTLVEMLVVIAIIVVLAGLLIPAIALARRSAARAQTQSLLGSVASAAEQFRTMNGGYPEELQISTAPVDKKLVQDLLKTTSRTWDTSLQAVVSTPSDHVYSGSLTHPIDQNELDPAEVDLNNEILTAALQSVDRDEFGAASKHVRNGRILDSWGKPIRYRPFAVLPYVAGYAGDERFRAHSDDPPHPDTFQLWSVGPDTIDESGAGDDIKNW